MKASRYYVYDKTQKLYVGGVLAKSPEVASEMAREFGTDCEAHLMTAIRRTFKQDFSEIYWTKDSAYGTHYKCKVCGKEHKGTGGGYNHWERCPLYVNPYFRGN